ncbi:hypothetical protein B0H17DRAFT_1066191 [Mycena rosella]|uniref:Uncharacterized protein n=1 Tax=Mycena rosella TaxID=1033263 RepID=A0AAD7DER1_MYCRO|nr:hypothetical protein B0H17DRAFT_1066191 [Mycena rosella]
MNLYSFSFNSRQIFIHLLIHFLTFIPQHSQFPSYHVQSYFDFSGFRSSARNGVQAILARLFAQGPVVYR